MELEHRADAVQTREELAAFVIALRDDLLTNADDWENPTLDRYLEAFAAWCVDLPGYSRNRGEPQPEQPDWQLVAQILMAASKYE